MTMQDGFNLKALFPSYNGKDVSWFRLVGNDLILSAFSTIFCIVGLLGNGNIIWLLGFHIKRKPFSIYILNLAVADFGSLVFLLSLNICFCMQYFYVFTEIFFELIILLSSLFLLIHNSYQLLLASISIHRGVSALFPNWYQHHQSPMWSTIVCAFIWTLSCALYGVPLILFSADLILVYEYEILLSHIVAALICLLLVTISLFITVFLKPQPCQCGNLSKVVLLILLSSFLFTVLAYTICLMFPLFSLPNCVLLASLKSSINPLIYFMAGRQNSGKFQERMMVILQRVFKEERDTRMERPPPSQTSHL